MFHSTFAAMNTRISIVLPAVGEPEGWQLAGEVQALVEQQESLMSRFGADGALALLNREASQGTATMPDQLWDVIASCQQHHRMTHGAFDIAHGGTPGNRGMRLLDIDRAARSLRFRQTGVRLDLGAIGKGIALDRIRQHLVQRGIGQAFLSFGESSVAVIGTHPATDCWPVGVEHLFQPGVALHGFALLDSAMSTSGNRLGQAHIVDPATGQLVRGCRTVSVSCASASDAEALSTALFILAPAGRAAVMDNYPGARAVEFAYTKHHGRWIVEKKWQHDDSTS